MVRVKIVSGPWAGRVREFSGTRVVDLRTGEAGEEVKPRSLFISFLRCGWRWEVDYTEATPEEALAWARPDLVVRVVRALERGLPVKFLGREYRVGPEESVREAFNRFKDNFLTSGRMVTLDADDENGVVIGVRGWEQ